MPIDLKCVFKHSCLSLKSDDSNFVQNYFAVGLIFCGKKNWDQIGNDVTMTSSLL